MSALAIDTWRYVKRLRSVGVSEEEAEVHAEALTEAVRETLVTKVDFDTRIAALESSLRLEIREQKSDILKWLIPLLIGQTAVLAALVKLL